MTGHNASFSNKVRDAVAYLIVVFLILPGLLGLAILISGLSLQFFGFMMTIYYLVSSLAIVIHGATWLERKFQ